MCMATSRHASEEIDKYLSGLPENVRAALERLRSIIRETEPNVTERVGYQIPVFRLNRDIVAFASHKKYCSFYTMSPQLIGKMKDQLRGFRISGATIHFSPEYPIPKELIVKIVEARRQEILP